MRSLIDYMGEDEFCRALIEDIADRLERHLVSQASTRASRFCAIYALSSRMLTGQGSGTP